MNIFIQSRAYWKPMLFITPRAFQTLPKKSLQLFKLQTLQALPKLTSPFKTITTIGRHFSSNVDAMGGGTGRSHGQGKNMLNPDLYTEKAWSSIAKLPNIADNYRHQYLESSHILKSILDDGPGGLAQRALKDKCGVDLPTLESQLDIYLLKQPKVYQSTSKIMGK